MADNSKRMVVLVPVIAALILAGLWVSNVPGALVVYCAHDAVYSQQILDDFTRKTGIPVQVRFDTEATKSLGLINLIVQERQQPRCDVFWNNELLGMVELRDQGILEPYQGSGWNRIPEQYRDPDGYWVGFAARMRVVLFNINQVSADEETWNTLMSLQPDRVAIAKPLFGTTLTHYTVMWHLWGSDQLKEWHTDLRLRGVREVDGNAAVKDLVAMGTCDAGLTDNDDAFVALDEKQPVEMLPVRLGALPQKGGRPLATGDHSNSRHNGEGGSPPFDAKPRLSTIPLDNSSGESAQPAAIATASTVAAAGGATSYTICIPNTAGIIKGTKHLAAAQQLVDFLASAETELALGRSKSRQVPLGPVDQQQLPKEVKKLAAWSDAGIDLRPLLRARRECLEWLKTEYVK